MAPRPSTVDRAHRWQIVTAFAAVYTIWGSTYLAIRIAIDTLPPFLMAGGRFILAGAVLLIWAGVRDGWQKPTPRQWAVAGLFGMLFLGFGNGGVVWAELRIPTGLTSLLVACTPAWTAVVDWLRPGGRRPGVITAAGLVLGMVGVAILVLPGRQAAGAVDPGGALALMTASIAWSIGSVFLKGADLPRSPALSTGMQMLLGGSLLLAAGLISGEAADLAPGDFSIRSLTAVGYLVLFGSIIGFSAFTFLLRHAPPTRVSTYAYVNPMVAVFLGWVFAGETLSPRMFLAAAIILGAVVMITFDRGRATGVASEESLESPVPEAA